MYLRSGKFFRNQILLDYLGRWRNQSCQIFFQSVHSGVSGKGSNFAIFSINRGWPLQLLYYRTTGIIINSLEFTTDNNVRQIGFILNEIDPDTVRLHSVGCAFIQRRPSAGMDPSRVLATLIDLVWACACSRQVGYPIIPIPNFYPVLDFSGVLRIS